LPVKLRLLIWGLIGVFVVIARLAH